MIKKVIIVSVVALILASCSTSSINESNQKGGETKMADTELQQSQQQDILKKYSLAYNILSDDDMIKNEEVALQIAEAILVDVYGDMIKETMPLKAELDQEFKIWVVKGQLGTGKIGGIPIILIRQQDGQVIYISHTK